MGARTNRDATMWAGAQSLCNTQHQPCRSHYDAPTNALSCLITTPRRGAHNVVPDPQEFARHWIEAWNAHDLDRILAHYCDDFQVTTPMIKVALGVDSGTLRGKEAIRRYWQAALQKVPDLRFDLIEATAGIDSVAIYYKAVLNKRAIEVMFFDHAGKVERVVVHYT
jgi:hypothetical protein